MPPSGRAPQCVAAAVGGTAGASPAQWLCCGSSETAGAAHAALGQGQGAGGACPEIMRQRYMAPGPGRTSRRPQAPRPADPRNRPLLAPSPDCPRLYRASKAAFHRQQGSCCPEDRPSPTPSASCRGPTGPASQVHPSETGGAGATCGVHPLRDHGAHGRAWGLSPQRQRGPGPRVGCTIAGAACSDVVWGAHGLRRPWVGRKHARLVSL